MNILFLSLGRFDSISQYSLYTDLLRKFHHEGHKVYVLSSRERKLKLPTVLIEENNVKILKLKTGNITKTNLIEKGLSTIFIEYQYIMSIKKYFATVKFDLVLYSTPPITFSKIVEYIKNRDNCLCYLLLKDIFPQNAVDIGILKKSGISSLIYKYFRLKEKRLYALSDYIGCMSTANCEYILQNNPELNKNNIEVCPNSIEIRDFKLNCIEKKNIRRKYNIPLDKKIFVYGGNLGKPQGIEFLLKCLYAQKDNPAVYFLIIGNGTEYNKIKKFINTHKLNNTNLIKTLPKEEYDKMIAACDIGMIFLDFRFTIPNFPSRLLTYMQAGLPVLACTDTKTDIKEAIVNGKFGWWCESNNVNKFNEIVSKIAVTDLEEFSVNSYKYLCENYSVQTSYDKIKAKILN